MASDPAQSDAKVSVYITHEDRVCIDAARGGIPRSTFLRRLLEEDIARSDGKPLEVPPTGLARAEAVERISVRISADLNARARHRVGPGSVAGHVRNLVPVPVPTPAPAPRRDRASLRQRLAALRRPALRVQQVAPLRGTQAVLLLRGRRPERTLRIRIASEADLPQLGDALRAAAGGETVSVIIWPTLGQDLDVLEHDALAAASSIGIPVAIERRSLTWKASGVRQRAVNWRLRRA